MALVVDGINVNNWQRTKDAHRRPPRNVPKPIPRPVDETPEGQHRKQQQEAGLVHVGNGVMATKTTVDEFMKMRAEREQRWREKHGRKGGKGGRNVLPYDPPRDQQAERGNPQSR